MADIHKDDDRIPAAEVVRQEIERWQTIGDTPDEEQQSPLRNQSSGAISSEAYERIHAAMEQLIQEARRQRAAEEAERARIWLLFWVRRYFK